MLTFLLKYSLSMIRTISSGSLFQIQGIIANVLDCMILNQILMAVDEESKMMYVASYLGMHRMFVFLSNRVNLLRYVFTSVSHNITATQHILA